MEALLDFYYSSKVPNGPSIRIYIVLDFIYLFIYFEMVTCIDQKLYSIKELYWETAGKTPKIQPPPKKGEAIQKGTKQNKSQREPNQNDDFPPIWNIKHEEKSPETIYRSRLIP